MPIEAGSNGSVLEMSVTRKMTGVEINTYLSIQSLKRTRLIEAKPSVVYVAQQFPQASQSVI
jgi:hypothetical protein